MCVYVVFENKYHIATNHPHTAGYASQRNIYMGQAILFINTNERILFLIYIYNVILHINLERHGKKLRFTLCKAAIQFCMIAKQECYPKNMSQLQAA